MKSSRKWMLAGALALAGAATLSADLARYLQHVDAASRLRAVFFRASSLTGGVTEVRRPPKETRPELTRLLTATPNDAELYALRAKEGEQALDIAAAEADWKKYTELAQNKDAAWRELAEFYHRRVRPQDEMGAYLAAGKLPSPAGYSSNNLPPQWFDFEFAMKVVREQGLNDDQAERVHRERIARFPDEQAAYQYAIQGLAAMKRYRAAEDILNAYTRRFPKDDTFPIQARADIARARGTAREALAVYEKSFRPQWPWWLVTAYFTAMKEANAVPGFLSEVNAAISSQPAELAAPARLYFYYRVEGNRAAAQRALADFRGRKEARQSAFTGDELLTLAAMFEEITAYEDAARAYYAAYSLPAATAAQQEQALAGITNLLLSMPETPLRFGAGDLSMYRDIATMDRYPGALNGILSLLLNTQNPEGAYQGQQNGSLSYFHRAKASELMDVLEKRFPNSPQRAPLMVRLVSAYGTVGEWNAVIRTGRKYLATFPDANGRTEVAMAMAGAHATLGQPRDELAVYDATLKELSAKAKGKPFSDRQVSSEYQMVLDRYVARLVSMKRVNDALVLYRNEISRNPDDSGLYERLAGFLDQNKLGAQTEQLYQQAAQRFNTADWWQKLARWYLREKRTADLDRITAQVAKTFSGTDLESYFKDVVTDSLDVSLYRQLNLYAHQRFPDDMVFVNNLLNSYDRPKGGDPAAFEALLRRYWTFDANLRNRFFAFLSARGRLRLELEAIRGSQPAAGAGNWAQLLDANPAAAMMLAEGETWQAHYERSAPLMLALHNAYPADEALANRAASVHRSLAAFDLKMADTAVAILTEAAKADPRNYGPPTTIGDIYADSERFDKAREWWLKLPNIEPHLPKGYLESATVFWDYFRYDDALKQIDLGRRKLNNTALFSYEAGAIYEGKRDFAHAVAEYVKGAAAESPSAESRDRLVVLARRPQARDFVETETNRALSGNNPTPAALQLRIAVLEAQERRPDMEKTLAALAARASSPELLTAIEQVASQRGFDSVGRQVMARQLALAADPIDKLQLRLSLVRFDETHNSTSAAAQQIEALYRENPLSMGVVRETVDYYWRAKNADRAIAVLLEASRKAHPQLATSFTVEAGRKALDAGQYARVRTVLDPLVKADPFKNEYLSLIASSYAGEGDDKALRAFYLAKLDELKKTSTGVPDRDAKAESLRAGLIPALTRLQDYQGAVDQYIERINRSPENSWLVSEAATYARAHGLEKRLTDYYAKTSSASPKDYRWPYVEARLAAALESYDTAIAAYRRAVTIRPDRTDLLEAQAGFEARLMRFDEAANTYAKLYDLSYRNAAWMVKVAEMRARLNQPDATVAALRKGFFEGRSENAQDLYEVARRLESWDLVTQARPFVEKSLSLEANSATQVLYSRILTRLRQADVALAKAIKYEDSAPSLSAIATAVGTYYTPEEKQAFAAALDKARAGLKAEDAAARLTSVAHGAGLIDLEARLLLGGGSGFVDRAQNLEVERMRAVEVGRILEARAKAATENERQRLFSLAVESYRLAGTSADELRVLLAQKDDNQGGDSRRMYELLLRRDTKRLLALSASDLTAVSAAADGDNADLALSAVKAFAASQTPLWGNAYTALTGYHYGRTTQPIRDAFAAALGPNTVGAQLQASGNRDSSLVGDPWFYYGARFGDWLLLAQQPQEADDYLPSSVEDAPARSSAYAELARAYERSGQPAKALEQYQYTVELAPNRADALDHMATILYDRGERERALATWKQALGAFQRQMNGRYGEHFWEDLPATFEHLASRKLLAQFDPEIQRLLRTYVLRNGYFRSAEVLKPILDSLPSAAARSEMLIGLSRSANDPLQFVTNTIEQSSLEDEIVARLYEHAFSLAAAKVDRSFGQAHGVALSEARQLRMRHVIYLTNRRRGQDALNAIARMDPPTRKALPSLPLYELRAAALAGSLDKVLARSARDGREAISSSILLQASEMVRKDGLEPAARTLAETAYSRELEAGNLTAANFLGLAEIRLKENDAAAALTLLRRLTATSAEPFDEYLPAAQLLSRNGRKSEAAEFFAARLKSTPWDAAAATGLAECDATRNLELAKKVAGSKDAPYGDRVAAANTLGANHAAGDYGSVELTLLASGNPIPAAAADKPYFYAARVAAADAAKTPQEKAAILRAAVAVRPADAPARIRLISAASAGRLNDTLLLAARQFVRDNGLPFFVMPQDADEGYRDDSNREGLADRFLPGLDLSVEERARLARSMGDAFRVNGRFSPASLYYQIASALSPPGPARQQAETALANARAEFQRRVTNAQRKPNFTTNLDQGSIVLPRVALSAVAAPRPQGGVQ